MVITGSKIQAGAVNRNLQSGHRLITNLSCMFVVKNAEHELFSLKSSGFRNGESTLNKVDTYLRALIGMDSTMCEYEIEKLYREEMKESRAR